MNHQSSFSALRVMAPDGMPVKTVYWIGLDVEGTPTASGHARPDQLPASQTLEVVLPAKRVAPLQITLPQAAGRHTKQILAQALDDRLLGKLETVHYVQGTRTGDKVLVWVVDRDWFSQTLALFTAAGRPPNSTVVEYAFLPDSSQVVSAEGDGYCFFRDTEGVYACVDSAATLAALYPEQTIQTITSPLNSQSIQAKTNLLTGPYASQSPFILNWAAYRHAAVLAGILVLLLLFQQILHWQSLSRREVKLQQEIRQTFATVFPGTPIVDPILQWQSMQSADSAPGANRDALNLASHIAETIQAAIHPRSLDVRDGVLRLAIPEQESASARTALEKMRIPFEFSPVDAGTVRLEIRQKR